MSQEPTLADLPEMVGTTLYQRVKDHPTPTMAPKLLAELEELRGEPIKFIDIHKLPCREISDEAVRKIEPVVSVHMITYNHEKFIAEAIESVVNQECDFPFELVIGEDCSTDRTREIIFDYQKRYPHIIRVLISDHNLYRSVGGNGARTELACRGKYIAYCEGDDRWTDLKKIQKQYDIFLSDKSISLVFGATNILYEKTGKLIEHEYNRLHTGITSQQELFNRHFYNKSFYTPKTLTAMIPVYIMTEYYINEPLFYARLYLGDHQRFTYTSFFGCSYKIPASMACYRIHFSGVSQMYREKIFLDIQIITLLFYKKINPFVYIKNCPSYLLRNILLCRLQLAVKKKNIKLAKSVLKQFANKQIISNKEALKYYVLYVSIPGRFINGGYQIVAKSSIVKHIKQFLKRLF